MELFITIMGIILTVLATATLTYISIATMIGPWIASTLVLFSAGFFSLFLEEKRIYTLTRIQSIAAGGGAIGIAIGFTFPMLYFLDRAVFLQMMQDPLWFSGMFALGSIAAGGLGIMLGSFFIDSFIRTKKLPFPSSAITYNVIRSSGDISQAKFLFCGALLAIIFYFLQHGFFTYKPLVPLSISLLATWYTSGFLLDLSPLYWSLGFTAGLKIAFPLFIGALSKNLFTYALHEQNPWVITYCTHAPTAENIITGFCTGLILAEMILGLLPSFVKAGKKIVHTSSWMPDFFQEIKNIFLISQNSLRSTLDYYCTIITNVGKKNKLSFFLVIFTSILFLSLLGFSPNMQLVLLLATIISTYYICLTGGEIGMIQFGRFATFVIIIMMALFALSPLQITVSGVFFTICAATASDLLFDYKVYVLGELSPEPVAKDQWLGLIVTSLVIGGILWLLFTQFTLGSSALFAQRGQTKALLVQALRFEPFLLLCGFAYAFLLKKLKISPTMVLGGLLMPDRLVSGLVAGALLTKLFKNKDASQSFAAGVFTTETLLMIIPAIVYRFFN